MLHRPMLIFRMPQMQVIDGIAVTEEERNKVEMYFLDVQVSTPPLSSLDPQSACVWHSELQLVL